MPKKAAKDIMYLGATNIALGATAVGAGALTGGGVHPAAGVAAVGRFMPVIGSTVMAGHVMRMTGGLMKAMPEKPKKKKY